jgi:AcrR family transcriptional regulator
MIQRDPDPAERDADHGGTAPVGSRQTQAERRALSEQRLLEAAIRLIAEQGCSRTTLAQIGEHAGYSRGLVTERFGSKQGLVEILARKIQERFAFEALGPALEGRTGLQAVLIGADTYLDALERGSETVRAYYVLMAESIGLVPEVRPTFARANREFRAVVEGWIRDGVESGEIRDDVQAGAHAVSLVGTLRGIALQWLVDPEGIASAFLRSELRDSLEKAPAR